MTAERIYDDLQLPDAVSPFRQPDEDADQTVLFSSDFDLNLRAWQVHDAP